MCFASESMLHRRHGSSRSGNGHAAAGRRAGWRSIGPAVLVGAACLISAGCGGGGYANGGSGGTPTPSPTPSPTPTSAASETISGTVVDAYNNSNGLANAPITVNGHTTTTDSTGSFSVTLSGAQSAINLTIAPPSGSVGLATYVFFTSSEACANPSTPTAGTLSISLAGVSAGQNDALGTITVYNLSNQGQQPPPAPCVVPI